MRYIFVLSLPQSCCFFDRKVDFHKVLFQIDPLGCELDSAGVNVNNVSLESLNEALCSFIGGSLGTDDSFYLAYELLEQLLPSLPSFLCLIREAMQ